MRHRLPVVAFLATLVATNAVAQPAGPFTPRHMLELAEFVRGSEPVLAPAGDLAAYALVDLGDEKNIRAPRPTGFLWVVPVPAGNPRRIGSEQERGDLPVWSPDGRSLAYIRWTDAGGRLAIWDRQTERVRLVGPALGRDRAGLPSTSLPPQWTPDCRKLIVAVSEPLPLEGEQPRVRVLKSTDPIVPGDARFTDSRRWRLMAVDIASGREQPVTRDPIALRGFRLSPDGVHVLYRAVTPETLGRFRKEELETWVAAIAGDDAPRLALAGRRPAWIAFSPDSRELLFPDQKAMWGVPVAGGSPRKIIDDFPERTSDPEMTAAGRLAVLAARPGTGPPDPRMYSILRPIRDLLLVDVAAGVVKTLTAEKREDEIADVIWSGDGSTLLYRAIDSVTSRESIMRWTVGRDQPETLLALDEALGSLSPSADGRSVTFTAQSAVNPPDAFIFAASGRRPLTQLNPWTSKLRFVAPEIVDYHSADGEPLQALLFRPNGASSSSPVPVVTFVYEKLTSQRHRFNAEAQMHVAHGYAYLMPDVLVKPGYTGESFVKSVVPAVNAVRAMGFTNGRFGITGGSFGGYAGLFLISHVDIFSAAVLRAPPSEFFSTWGDGRDRDIWTIETGQARTGGNPWEVPERYIANSPFFHADRVITPVLILHGEKDFTVPFQQGEMMFHALRALGRPAEFAIYREGDHSIVRGSRADFLDVYQRTLDWWQKYLRRPANESGS